MIMIMIISLLLILAVYSGRVAKGVRNWGWRPGYPTNMYLL